MIFKPSNTQISFRPCSVSTSL
ncbi:hypothetical protein Nmel_012324, partial [Mimus melanotis]